MIKTLKTLLVETHIQYLKDRGYKIYIKLNKEVLDKLNGFVPIPWNVDKNNYPDTLVLNISPAAIYNFLIEDNKFFFNISYQGKSVYCCVPTASIKLVFNPEHEINSSFSTKDFANFNTMEDLAIELAEKKEYEKLHKKTIEKPSHLHVVK